MAGFGFGGGGGGFGGNKNSGGGGGGGGGFGFGGGGGGNQNNNSSNNNNQQQSGLGVGGFGSPPKNSGTGGGGNRFKMFDRDPRFHRCTFSYLDRDDVDKKEMCKTYIDKASCVSGGCEWNYPPTLVKHKAECNSSPDKELKYKD